MSELKEKLHADMTAAMKAKDALRLGTLRMLLAAIQNAEVAGAQARELTDADVIAVLAKEAKKRNEAAVVYEQAGRGELAANERAEESVIDEYLPTPLTEAEVADIADTAIAEQIGERPGMKQMGQVMKIATALAAGRADGSRISAAVKARL
ncbi:GatB/YqeY domain-containing protein [Nocardia crassostreae]|uniref:GatB/YqeY domain-containing protein n=1 Tax=Nocardia crassostreae TaxID=53428 RepID=UPI000836A340|nr:GatB/YqeY domain-containing protein [Nocardia crassostreae]